MSEADPIDTITPADLVALTCTMVAAYVSHNSTPVSALPGLIADAHAALSRLAGPQSAAPAEPAAPLVPAVPIKKSITDDFIICLEDGKRFKSLKRHIESAYGLTPAEYRAKWGLPADYPMVAPNYSAQRTELAKTMGLGRKAPANTIAA